MARNVGGGYIFLTHKRGFFMRFFKYGLSSVAAACFLFLGCGDDSSSNSNDDGAMSSINQEITSSSSVADFSSSLEGDVMSSGIMSAATAVESSSNMVLSGDDKPVSQNAVSSSVVASSSDVATPSSVAASSSDAASSAVSSDAKIAASSSSVAASSPSVAVTQGNTFDSMFFGAWVGGPEETPQPSAANVAAFEKLQDRHLDVISVFSLWQYNDWNWTRTYADIAKQNGSILLVTWMPTPYTAADILSGKCDNYIDDFARGVKDFGDEIWLRPLHEANGDWYTWGTGKDGVNNSSDKVAEAFRYIVKRFRTIGVPNVKWVWTTNASNSGAGTSLTGAYPGDEYVDYNSIDGYNWGAAQSWSSWQSFSTVFSEAYKALSAYDKPMFIAEFASTEKGGNKAEWINEMFRDLPTKFPKIVGLMWFSQSKEDNEGDWALNTSDAAVEAWKKGIASYPQAKR